MKTFIFQLRSHKARVLSRIYLLGEKSLVAAGDELPKGVQVRMPPGNFLN